MKFRRLYSSLLLLLVPFLFTGCYTQFQTFAQYPAEDRHYSSWDDGEEYKEQSLDNDRLTEAEALERELALEEMGIYFQDYETKRWYEEHYANKLFWEGYVTGYEDGYFDGWANLGYFPYSARYSINRHRYLPGYTGAFEYYNFYHFSGHGFYASYWFNYPGYYYNGFYAAHYAPFGYYDFNYYWGRPYNRYYSSYSNYLWNKKYNRDASLYRKGPRNSGLVNRGEYRTRGDNGLNRSNKGGDIRTRNTGVTRTRGINTSRVRGTKGSSVGRGSSGNVGRSRGSSSVGKSRSSGSSTRSRSNGSSVGKRSSDGNSGKSRARGGNDKYSSNFGQTSVRDINISDFRSRTYTIPARKIARPEVRSTRSGNAFFDFFKTSDFDHRRTSSSYNDGNQMRRSIHSPNRSSGNVRRSSVTTSSSRSSSKVTRSSSSSKSSETRSRGSSSSSKRSRGGN